jgi:alpha-D-xyloside xylohydrolase|uniref:TIM-barrel domain-containing protein n=1 Tax=Orrella sp. TaxID=1921583 RepID=UPI0040479CC3
MNLESLKLLQSSPSKVIFDAGSGTRLVIEPHAPGMYRIRFGAEASVATDSPMSGRAKLHADLLVARPEAIFEIETEALPGNMGWRLAQADTALVVGQAPFGLSVMRGEHVLLALTEDGISNEEQHWSFGFQLKADESVYGLGQTLTDLNRRGEYVVSDDPKHRALPFAWSPSGWGIYVNTLGRVDHDVAHSESSTYEIHAQAQALDLFILAGDPCEMLNQYTALTGRAGQPSLWALGAWLKQPPNCTLTELLEKVEQVRARGVCIDTVMLLSPMAWRFQDAKLAIEWDSTRFPDPKQVLELFAKRSIQVCLTTLPAIEVGTNTFEELEDRGWLLAHESGDACVFKGNEATGGKDFGLLDLTYKDIYQHWVERHRQLAEDGISAVRCDVPFEIPAAVTSRGGETGSRLQALYPMLVRQSLYEACAGHKVPPEGVVLTSDLTPAAQRYPWQAPVLVEPTWDGLRQTIAAALSVGASGVPLQMHAVGSQAGEPASLDTELYLRWLAMTVFSGNMQFENLAELESPQWDDASRECFAQWMQWRYRLIPYILGAVEDAGRTGLPVQRSMAMCFANDQEAHRWDSQYMLGPALLVAPLTKPGRLTQVYLPAGDAWWDLSTGWRYEGGAVLEMDVELDRLPVFGREGHMLCLGPVAPNTSEFNSARILDEVWMFGMPVHNPVVMRNKIRVMQMQGSSYIKGLEGLKILPSEGLEVKRRGAEVRISRAR